YWLEVSQEGRLRRVQLACSPIDVAPLLRARLFEAKGPTGQPMGVVLTSATLATGSQEHRQGNGTEHAQEAAFDHIRQRLGCPEAPAIQLGSPFDYAQQAQLIVDRAMPDPTDAAFVDRLWPAILRELDRSDGGAFVLFTSYDLLRRTAQGLRPHLMQRG